LQEVNTLKNIPTIYVQQTLQERGAYDMMPQGESGMASIGERVARFREDRGLSQYALAREAHVSSTYIQNLEKDKPIDHSLSHLRRVAHVLGKRVGDLIDDADFDPVRDEYLEAARHLSEYLPDEGDLPVVVEFTRAYSILPPDDRAEAWHYISYFFRARNIHVNFPGDKS
jgi:transcriptional regulator with XRE-family HTH domain